MRTWIGSILRRRYGHSSPGVHGKHICVGKNIAGRRGYVVCLKDGSKTDVLFVDKDGGKAEAQGEHEATTRGIPFTKV